MTAKRKSKGAYMISSVAEMYGIHPQTLRLYEREGLLKPSRTDGNTRLYTEEDLQRLEFILNLARDLGVNIAGIAIILCRMKSRSAPAMRTPIPARAPLSRYANLPSTWRRAIGRNRVSHRRYQRSDHLKSTRNPIKKNREPYEVYNSGECWFQTLISTSQKS
jgi:DNA-binding transcriptional MerR regulator